MDAVTRGAVDALALGCAGASSAIAAAHVFFEEVVGRFDQVVPVLIVARVLAQCEQVAGGDVACVAFAVGRFALGLLLFDAHAGVVFAVACVGIATGPVVEFAVVVGVACGLLLPGVEAGVGLLKIVVVGREMAAGDVFRVAPAVDEVFVAHLACAVVGVERDGAGAMGEWAV